MLSRRCTLYVLSGALLVGCNKVYPPEGAIYSELLPEHVEAVNKTLIAANYAVIPPSVEVYSTADIGIQAFATKYYDGSFSIHLSKGLYKFSDDLIATVLAHEYCHIILDHHNSESYWGRHEGEEREADKCGIEIAKAAGFDACALEIIEPSNIERTNLIKELCK